MSDCRAYALVQRREAVRLAHGDALISLSEGLFHSCVRAVSKYFRSLRRRGFRLNSFFASELDAISHGFYLDSGEAEV